MLRSFSVEMPGLALSLLLCASLLVRIDFRSWPHRKQKKTKPSRSSTGHGGSSVRRTPILVTAKLPAQIEMTKLVIGGRYVWSVAQNGKAVAGAGGNYTTGDGDYTEEATFAIGQNQQGMVGKSFKFTWKIEDGKWYHKGTLKVGNAEQEIDEIWERVP